MAVQLLLLPFLVGIHGKQGGLWHMEEASIYRPLSQFLSGLHMTHNTWVLAFHFYGLQGSAAYKAGFSSIPYLLPQTGHQAYVHQPPPSSWIEPEVSESSNLSSIASLSTRS